MSWRELRCAAAFDEAAAPPLTPAAMAEPRYSRESQCGSKRRHFTRSDAERALVRDEAGNWTRLEAYRCAWCGCWHNGHAPRARDLIPCAGCGRPWRPRTWFAKDGSVIRQRDPDAKDALANAITSGQRGKWRTVGPQRCECCGWWHLGDRLATSDAGLVEHDDA